MSLSLSNLLVSHKFQMNNAMFRPSQSRLNWVRNFAGKRKRIYVPNSIGKDGGASFLEDFSGCYPGYASVMEKAMVIEGMKTWEVILMSKCHQLALANGVYKGLVAVHKYLKPRLQTLSSFEEILQVANKLTHGDKKISDIIAKAIEKDGNVFPLLETDGTLGHPSHIKRVKQWLEINMVNEDDFIRAEAIRALKVVKAAMSGGSIQLLPGGVAELVNASKILNELRTKSSVEKIGVQLLQNALKMPMFTTASIAGFDGSTIIQNLLEQDNQDIGFDFFSGEFITRYEHESMILFFTLHDELYSMQRMAEMGEPLLLRELRFPQLHFLYN